MYVEVEKVIDAPLDAIWAMLADFANQGAATGLVESPGEGFGVGATCTSNVEGSSVRELCVNFDPDKFILGYTVKEDDNGPIYDYVGTVRLYYVSTGKTRVHWYSNWKWRDRPANQRPIEDYERMMKTAYLTVIDNMERAAETPA